MELRIIEVCVFSFKFSSREEYYFLEMSFIEVCSSFETSVREGCPSLETSVRENRSFLENSFLEVCIPKEL
jgi:hypothetical protein